VNPHPKKVTTSFGSITEVATPGREIQLSARLSF
jgi:hypothetical protein